MAVYCGQNSQMSSPLFVPRAQVWNADKVLGELASAPLSVPTIELLANYPTARDMKIERDAENLCLELDRRRGFGQQFSAEFVAFEGAWRRDEWLHYLFLRRIACRLFGQQESEVNEALNVSGDFENYEFFLADEFRILVLIARDELITTRGYVADRGLYEALGSVFLDCFNRIIIDEANHYHNALSLLKRFHRSRLHEVPELVEHLRAVEAGNLGKYDCLRTFFGDRSDAAYTPDLLAACDAKFVRDLVR